MAMLLGKIATGAGAMRTPCRQQGQAYFGRMCLKTRTLAGITSSCSQISSPMRSSAVPSRAQIFSCSGMSWTISTRGSCALSFLRPRLPRSCAGIVIVSRRAAMASDSASISLKSHRWSAEISTAARFSEERPKSCAFSQRFSSSRSLMRSSRASRLASSAASRTLIASTSIGVGALEALDVTAQDYTAP